MFRDLEDYNRGFNCFALALYKTGSTGLVESFMATHTHQVVHYYEVRPKTKNVDHDIVRFIKGQPGKSGIIYCLSRKKVEELAEVLKANDISAAAYHAGSCSSRSQAS